MAAWILSALRAIIASLLIASPATAAVIHVGPSGFELKQVTHIKASALATYAALIQPSHWWNSEHTFSGSAANLTIDPHAGGCFCEALPNGGQVRHETVGMT